MSMTPFLQRLPDSTGLAFLCFAASPLDSFCFASRAPSSHSQLDVPQLATLVHTHAVYLHSDAHHSFTITIHFPDRMDFNLRGRVMRQEVSLVVYNVSQMSAALLPPRRPCCLCPTLADALAPFLCRRTTRSIASDGIM